ncbi:hypothetical protein AMATHDRAFT_48661 [Amanita thiersii Skay4041]|uniref:Uncharacterized protein n=1 Tax=Amanita thiersii Skay4041 TaxID=703135 RepID=A0A2A9NP23_9AGAR|nr:hypothetical protein AMATHDRAFT_48661 [Amanita thiersii Skay4041]
MTSQDNSPSVLSRKPNNHPPPKLISSDHLAVPETGILGPSLRRRPEPRPSQAKNPLPTPPPYPARNPTKDQLQANRHATQSGGVSILKPFEYDDHDEDDFRDYFDFDKAWVQPVASPSLAAGSATGEYHCVFLSLSSLISS